MKQIKYIILYNMNNQQISNTNCKLVSTIWIERGIILTIMYYLIKKYKYLLKKIIIIEKTKYRILFKILFPTLIFENYKNNNENNFYFNIRNIIKKQDIIIDYLNNYNDYINTKKIKLVPWFDTNDILISYNYDSQSKLSIDKYLNFIINFNKCRRGNYNNDIYDKIIENKIFDMYLNINNNMNLLELNNLINKYINNYLEIENNYILQIDKKEDNKQLIQKINSGLYNFEKIMKTIKLDKKIKEIQSNKMIDELKQELQELKKNNDKNNNNSNIFLEKLINIISETIDEINKNSNLNSK